MSSSRVPFSVAAALTAALFALPVSPLRAAQGTQPSPIQTAHRRSPYVGAVAVDAATGRILFRDNPKRECYPASCTKLMTARILLKEIEAGNIAPTDSLVQSKRSAQEEPSKIDLAVGETISIDDAIKALMLKSANDVAVMVAEKVSGSVEAFVARMNEEAKALGMAATRFASPNGLPPPRNSKRDFDKSTASDLAILGLAILKEQPKILDYTRLATATVPGRGGAPLTMQNHNNFLWRKGTRMREVDGLKTGYIDAGGSSIVLTGARDGRRAIVVVAGSASAKERDENAGRLLSDALDALAW